MTNKRTVMSLTLKALARYDDALFASFQATQQEIATGRSSPRDGRRVAVAAADSEASSPAMKRFASSSRLLERQGSRHGLMHSKDHRTVFDRLADVTPHFDALRVAREKDMKQFHQECTFAPNKPPAVQQDSHHPDTLHRRASTAGGHDDDDDDNIMHEHVESVDGSESEGSQLLQDEGWHGGSLRAPPLRLRASSSMSRRSSNTLRRSSTLDHSTFSRHSHYSPPKSEKTTPRGTPREARRTASRPKTPPHRTSSGKDITKTHSPTPPHFMLPRSERPSPAKSRPLKLTKQAAERRRTTSSLFRWEKRRQAKISSTSAAEAALEAAMIEGQCRPTPEISELSAQMVAELSSRRTVIDLIDVVAATDGTEARRRIAEIEARRQLDMRRQQPGRSDPKAPVRVDPRVAQDNFDKGLRWFSTMVQEHVSPQAAVRR